MESAEQASLHAAIPDGLPDNHDAQEPNFAFLVHSQESLSRNTPPEVDNQRLARQKRRRTSPDDHAVLEAAFEQNPKPDKAARQELVKRVALGEKEVQIWFQNRRQTTRRKSKPILSHEFDASSSQSQNNRGTAFSSNCSSFTSSQEPYLSSQSSTVTGRDTSQNKNGASASRDACSSTANDDLKTSDLAVSSSIERQEEMCQNFVVGSMGTTRPRDPVEAFKSSQDRCRPGYLANRRSAPFIVHDETDDISASMKPLDRHEAGSSTEGYGNSMSAKPLRRSASLVKLSMDADGNAEVTARTGSTPSPPHPKPILFPQPTRRPGLGFQRSFSAFEQGTHKRAQDLVEDSFPRRPTVGRSRDARTWEFYCDSDARDALTKQAEREESGSATAAIGLIRSRSSKTKTLTPNSNKRNANVQKSDSGKRHKTDKDKSSKPKLGRTTSSVARLQTTATITSNQKQKAIKQATKHSKSNSKSAIFEDFDGDSDKENWVPGTQTRQPPRRRPVTSQESARILLESLREPSESSSLGAMLDRQSTKPKPKPKPSAVEDKENSGPEIDDEVAAFMGEESLPRVEDDLDCVQNLLRLSQAAWN